MFYFAFVAAIAFSTSSLSANPALFLTNQGKIEEAAAVLKAQNGVDDNLIEAFALAVLKKGAESKDKEEALLALFGASISLNEKAEQLIEKGCISPHPEIQIAALSMMARSRSDSAITYLNLALGAPHPLIRLEAAYLLAERKAPQATLKIESLMHKMPPEAHFLFPQLFARIGDEEAKRNLKKLLAHKDEKVRTETLLAIGRAGRDDLSREVRRALNHPDSGSKEAAAKAAALLKDEEAIPLLEKLSRHPSPSVKIAALSALKQLNRPVASNQLEAYAAEGNLFAISALADFPESKATLKSLLSHPDTAVRANATLSLLKLKEASSLQGLSEILIKDARDIAYLPSTSPSGALSAIKTIPSSRQNLAQKPELFEISLQLRERALEQAVNLSDAAFFELAQRIVQKGQNDLIPLLMSLLESKGSESLLTLREAEQKAGAPLIRQWAALTLYKLHEPGYEEKLKSWLKKEAAMDLIRFRPFVPWELRSGSTYDMSPNEKAGLWIAILEGLIRENPESAVTFLLELIAEGSQKNRFVFAGLLLRTIQ
jgi:HEAT repeat protein